MINKTLIDTSSWIEALRKGGSESVQIRIRKLVLEGSAVLCDMVLLELWNGAKGEREKKAIQEYQEVLEILPTSPDVWEYTYLLAQKCRTQGITVPATDLLIASCAFYHKVQLEYCDKDFDLIMQVNHKK